MDPSGMTTAQCLYLSNLDMEAVEQADVQLIADYAELWLASRTRNQPIRLDGATLQAEIGYDWFSQARDPWGAIH
jgi:Holliday junction resolvase-like predicted endonuclease